MNSPLSSNLRSRAYYLGLAETVRRVANEQKLYRETTIKELREAGDVLIELANATRSSRLSESTNDES